MTIADSDLQIVLKNVGDKPLTATPRFQPVGEGASRLSSAAVTLQPGEATLLGSSLVLEYARNGVERVSVHIQSTGEKGSLIGSLSTFNRRMGVGFEIPLRDSGGLRNSGGSYPIRVDGDFTTAVSILNVSISPIEFIATIRYPGGSYSLRPRKLEAGESALYDINQMRDKQVPDDYGTPLPKSFEKGQFNWSMYKGGAVPMLIGRSQIVSQSKGISSSYSCPVCCPNSGPWNTVNPGGLALAVDGFQAFGVNGETVSCYGYWDSYPTIVDWTHPQPSIATANTVDWGLADATGNSVGYTTERSEPYSRVEWNDDGMDCYPWWWNNEVVDQPIEVVDFSISGSQSVKDGETGSFSVSVTGGSATGYQWSFTAPSGAGNGPNVLFTSASSAQTNTDARWFAKPDVACPTAGDLPSYYNAVYTIKATVTFSGGASKSRETTLTVNALWDPAGFVDPNISEVIGGPTIGVDGSGIWRVTSKGTLARQIPTSATINVIISSQFYNKTFQHEQVHLNQWVEGPSHLFGDLYVADNFYDQIKNLTGTSQQDLINKLIQTKTSWHNAQGALYQQRRSQSEREAHLISDALVPQYVYQNCGKW